MPLSRRAFAGSLAAGLSASAQSPGRRPNFLFVIADDWGHDHAGAYGCKWVNTPAFDRVAREGILFRNCFTSNPKCSPSRATMLTGRNSWQLKEAVNHFSIFPKDYPVYPDLLRDAGYFIGHTGKGWGPGDFKSTGWKHNPAGPEFFGATLTPPYSGISNQDYAGNFERFLKERPAGQPFYFWLGGHEPHRVYEQGSGERAGRKPNTVDVPGYLPETRAVRSDMLDYALEVEWFDRHLGLALGLLEKAGELDNTVVVVTSDHGMPFPRVKGQIYEDGFHLPLAVRWGKGAKGGRVVEDFINARDFAPTFLDLAGVTPPRTMTGRSFTDVLRSDRSGVIDSSRVVMLVGKERHDLGRPNDWGYPVRAIRTRDYLYVHNYHPERWPAGDPETGYRNVDDGPSKTFVLSGFDEFYRMSFGKRPAEELYHIASDPQCLKNLMADPKHSGAAKDLRQKMEHMLREEGDGRVLGQTEFFDTIKYNGPRKHAWDTWEKYRQ